MFRAHELSHTLKTKVEGTPEEFWPFFEFIKLQDIFEAAGSLPGIERKSPFTEWHTPGNKRTVYFTTGDTATEEIIVLVPAKRSDVTVSVGASIRLLRSAISFFITMTTSGPYCLAF